MGFFSDFFGGGGKSAPKFSDLGVTDPTSGKPVYLSANEISTVMGATGGVAPTKFQAITDGFFKGAEQGQNFIQGISQIKAQSARTDAQEIQNEIDRQTQAATIQTRNNQILQQGIQAQVQTTELTNENDVLTSIHSGDPAKLIEAISNPKNFSAALKYNAEVDAVASGFKTQGYFTPQQAQALEKYNIAAQVAKNGDAQTNYQQAASAIAGSLPIQSLASQAGVPADQVLQDLHVIQAQRGIDPITGEKSMTDAGTVLLGPNGSKYPLDPAKNDYDKPLGDFLAAREKFRNPAGRYTLPTNESRAPLGITAAPSEATPTAGAATADGSVAALPQGQVTATPTPNAQTEVNPNAIGPTGAVIQTKIPALQPLNTKTTYKGTPLSRAITERQQQIWLENPGMTQAQAYNQANKEIIQKAPAAAKVKGVTADTQTLAANKRLMADKIDQMVKDAKSINYNLGSNPTDYVGRVGVEATAIGQSLDSALGVPTPKVDTNKVLKNIKSMNDALVSQYTIDTAANSGMGTKMFDSDKNQQMLQGQSPGLTVSEDQNINVATRLRGEANALDDENTIVATLDQLNIDFGSTADFVKRYHKDNPTLIFDEAAGTVILNPNRADPTKWTQEQLGINNDEAAKEGFTAPTKIPETAPPQTAGSGTATPFAEAKKENTSAFPVPPKTEGRGVGYNKTQATIKDLKAIAETAASGGNIRQFQSGGSLPLKMDKATPDLVARVIGAESLPGKTPGTVQANSTSPTGVKGLMQVTQKTFNGMANDNPDIPLTDREDPLQSVVAGTKHLNQMLQYYDGNVDLSLAAQNAGMGTVDAILAAQGFNKARATIDMIGPYLPKTQDTVGYVKKITSRGRVAEGQESAGEGFFKTAGKVASALNPFSVEEAQAEEPTATPPEIQQFLNPDGSVNLTIKGDKSTLDKEKDIAGPTTDAEVSVGGLDSSPRNDVPPVSEIHEALAQTSTDAKDAARIAGSAFPNVGKAVNWIQNSPIGKFLGEVKETQGFEAAQVFANAATLGLFDEGIGAVTQAIGGDSELATKEVRRALKDVRAKSPKLAFASDIIGSIAGGGGATMMLRALKGVQAIRTAGALGETIAPMTIREGAKIGAAQAGARGVGEGETPGQRLVGGATGAVLGGALGAAAPLASKIPVVGSPAVAGAAVGATVGALADGPQGAVRGAGVGTAVGAGTGLAVRYAPAIQNAITAAVVKLNDKLGLRAIGTLFSSIVGKTPSEAATNLTPTQAYAAQLLKHVSQQDIAKMADALKEAAKSNPELKLGFVDVADGLAEPATLVKLIAQVADDPATAAKVTQLLRDRAAGRLERVTNELGSPDDIAPVAERLQQLINTGKKAATDEALVEVGPLYAQAKEEVPLFVSPKIKELLTTPAMKKAVAAARASYKLDRPKNTTELADEIAKKVEAQEPITTFLEGESSMFKGAQTAATKAPAEERFPANSYEILTRAYRNLTTQIKQAANSEEKKRLGDLQRDLRQEMEAVNDTWKQANEEYTTVLGKTDVLRKNSQVKVISKLASGNVEGAVQKLMAMPVKEIEDLTAALTDPGILAGMETTPEAVNKILSDAAKGYLLRKLNTAVEGKNVAKNLITQGEQSKLKALLGEDQFDELFAKVNAESQAARSEARMGAGSHTHAMGKGQEKLDELTGKGNPAGAVADVVSGSWKFAAALGIKKILRNIISKPDPKKIEELADMLILSPGKSVEALEKVFKARNFTETEMARLQPYLKDLQAQLRGGATGIETSAVSTVQENNKPKQQ